MDPLAISVAFPPKLSLLMAPFHYLDLVSEPPAGRSKGKAVIIVQWLVCVPVATLGALWHKYK